MRRARAETKDMGVPREREVTEEAAEATVPARLRDVIGRPLLHWRGQAPLWVSFWVHGGAVYAGLALLARLHESLAQSEAIHPVVVVRLSLAYLLVAGLANLWLAVGAWRAGRRHQSVRTLPGWGTVAQVVVGFSVAFSLAGTLFMSPLLLNLWHTAFGSSEIDRYHIVMLKGGELMVEGGTGWGLTHDLEAVLNVHRRIHTVVLDSPGGWLTEGRRLRDLLAERGLSARVVRRCFSACAIAFLGAPRRELRAGALLGFHLPSATSVALGRGYLWSESYRKLLDDQARMLEAGVRPEFVKHVFTTPYEGMWVPTLAELVDAGVVTRILPPVPLPTVPYGPGSGNGADVPAAP